MDSLCTVLMVDHLFLQENTEILGYLLGSIAAFGSWASRIPPLSRIVRLGCGWDCGSHGRSQGIWEHPEKVMGRGCGVTVCSCTWTQLFLKSVSVYSSKEGMCVERGSQPRAS